MKTLLAVIGLFVVLFLFASVLGFIIMIIGGSDE